MSTLNAPRTRQASGARSGRPKRSRLRLVRRLAPFAAAALACAALSPQVLAHPHVWIGVRLDFVFDAANRPTGLVATWSFDEMFSSLATSGRDRDRDGRLSREELSGLSRTIVDASKEESNFTGATLDGAPVALSGPKDPWAEVGPDGKLELRFRLDFAAPLSLGGRELRVEVRDPDLYADFRFEAPAAPGAGLPAGCTVRLDDPMSALPSDPLAIEDRLINGPLATLASAVVLRCE